MNDLIFKVMVIDDEPLARKEMRFLLREHLDFSVEWEAGSVAEAQRILSACQPDVVFLDIHLRGGNGFDLMELFSDASDVVFVTAHDEYAIRAFEVNALDYLTKPVAMTRLESTLDRLRRKPGGLPVPSLSKGGAGPCREDDKVFIAASTGRLFVNCSQIQSISTVGGNYLLIKRISGAEHLVRGTVKDWEQKLPPELFLRVHRNAIVNVSRIRCLTRIAPRKHAVVLVDDSTEYSISRTLISHVEQLLT
ncbi:MAG: response regulator transcription factor [Deltaproteobacteria bacterium]|nr:response regulator transcription factor [Deltaproteobacteria bacterium]